MWANLVQFDLGGAGSLWPSAALDRVRFVFLTKFSVLRIFCALLERPWKWL